MKKFDKKLFDSLTSSEKDYKSAVQIADQLPFIKEQLIRDYWGAVLSELKDLSAIKGYEFITELKYGNLYISLLEGDSIYVCLEDIEAQQVLGLIVEYDKIQGKTKFREYVESIFQDEFEINDDEWSAFKSLSDDLSDNEWILKILPFQKEMYVKKKASELFNFISKYKKHMENIKILFLYK